MATLIYIDTQDQNTIGLLTLNCALIASCHYHRHLNHYVLQLP